MNDYRWMADETSEQGCYFIHFDRPICSERYWIDANGIGHGHTTQHYLGWSSDIAARIARHARGQGARLTEVAMNRGIGFTVVRVWPGVGADFEKELKRQKNGPRLCPICQPDSVARYLGG